MQAYKNTIYKYFQKLVCTKICTYENIPLYSIMHEHMNINHLPFNELANCYLNSRKSITVTNVIKSVLNITGNKAY